ncbi:MAG: hypothetical protein ABIZ34_09855 [Candidatus Limnocylindrales bacterium]
MAAILMVGGVVDAAVAQQPQPKVVIVVGPTDGRTAEYKNIGDSIATKARRFGAEVIKIYSPDATWTRVKAAAQGANLFVYLGHGNGYPSPYGAFQPYTKDGLGLNRSKGNGDSNTEYFGEFYIKRDLHLAPGAVVLLMRLCYAAGNSEGTAPTPDLSTARRRVDNYGAGFLRAGAKAVFAEIIGNAGYVLNGLFRTQKTMREIFWDSPEATGKFRQSIAPNRSPDWASGLLDPFRPKYYYRSIIGDLDYTASAWR